MSPPTVTSSESASKTPKGAIDNLLTIENLTAFNPFLALPFVIVKSFATSKSSQSRSTLSEMESLLTSKL